ncbi:RNA-guided pseudouridylation complex pseudouridine synthase subunit Cbf5 [Nanoarchaeota archaeon]|nr:MAG: RNA-guided pseudouridylation complex pseudouridine synthase subunit Cbf5 [Nanoarchaeota archaeon]
MIVKRKAKSSFGTDPYKRDINHLLEFGIINLDKPSGPTSHQCTYYVKKILNARKAGHSGTLDPKVTGVLPVALNSATKVLSALLVAPKEYIVEMKLHSDVDNVKKELELFSDTVISQVPPIKSAVKRRMRQRRIYELEVIEVDGRNVLFRIRTEAGFYVRKFCHDFGVRLGVGAHMASLRRIRAGPFDETTLVNFYDLIDAWYMFEKGEEKYLRKMLLPVEYAVKHLRKVYVLDSAVHPLCSGAQLATGGVAMLDEDIHKGDMVAVMTLKKELVLIGEATMSSEEIASKKGLCVKTKRVIMPKTWYPKL